MLKHASYLEAYADHARESRAYIGLSTGLGDLDAFAIPVVAKFESQMQVYDV